ncbi:glycosyltransferase [Bartonella sp. B10834G6]|uniref:glycosyltransferase family 2 protein n=1 Tax=Bartonella apis TaxID=1686310 RepID=UPI0018DB1296|nr:glycosyltransferase family 2 protein [Bartonella apis]MBH9982599.1 glycosyltransferase [Bartonella apis]
MLTHASVAIVIPCYNEELTVATVVSDAKKYVPDASVYVYDNNSTDKTSEIAKAAGAIVRSEKRQGKGNVIRRAFGELTEDVILIVDGDSTYDLSKAPEALKKFKEDNLDYLNIKRISNLEDAYPFGHRFGNKLLTGSIQCIFGHQISDMLSGYKIFSRRFVKSFPISSNGFEIETEVTVHALELNVAIDEISAPYGERPEGSESKLSTVKDGFLVGLTILRLIQLERPFIFYTVLALFFWIISLIIGYPVIAEYTSTGLVPRLPSAILAGFLGILGAMNFMVALILDLVRKTRADMKKLAFLSIK